MMFVIGYFNDFYRNLLKGELYIKEFGYVIGFKEKLEDVLKVLKGFFYIFNILNKLLNYVECYDNMIFFDMLYFNYKDKKIKYVY